MRQVTVTETKYYVVNIDDDNEIVKEYQDDDALINDCISYKFSKVLPVIEDGGVELLEKYAVSNGWEKKTLDKAVVYCENF